MLSFYQRGLGGGNPPVVGGTSTAALGIGVLAMMIGVGLMLEKSHNRGYVASAGRDPHRWRSR